MNFQPHTVKITAGMGVSLSTWRKDTSWGIWFSRLATKNTRDAVNIEPLTPPNVENATNKGIIHHIGP